MLGWVSIHRDVLLLSLFGTHAVAFGTLLARRRQLKYVRYLAIFVLLSTFYALRLEDVDADLGFVTARQVIRGSAWLLAAVSIGLLIRARTQRGRKPEA